MATYLRNGTDLRTSQYKKLTSLLSNLEGLLPYARIADALPSTHLPTLAVDPVAVATGNPAPKGFAMALQPQLEDILAHFVQRKALSASGETLDRISGKERRLGNKDAAGRVMAVGRRKESAARVWIVPVSSDPSSESGGIPGRVLVNSLALPEYFSMSNQREAAIHPMVLTETLGSFNVFAIAKGGGLAAQADAVAMGLARALVEWERCEVEDGRLDEGVQGWRETLKSGESHLYLMCTQGTDGTIRGSQIDRERSEDGREEEDGTAQGEEDAYLGQEVATACSGVYKHYHVHLSRE